MNEQIYTERKMLVGTALGGPLAGGYYLWRTLNVFGKNRVAVVAVVAALAILVISIGSSFIPGLDRLPNVVFYGLQFGLILGVARGYLMTEMAEHTVAGKAVYSWGNTLLVASISIVVTLGPLLALIYFSPSVLDGTTARYYGTLKHEIVFDSGNLTETESNKIADALTSAGFFDEELKKTIEVEKSNGRFVLTMYCNESASDDSEFIELCKTLRSDVQKSFPANPVVLDLAIDTPEKRFARLE